MTNKNGAIIIESNDVRLAVPNICTPINAHMMNETTKDIQYMQNRSFLSIDPDFDIDGYFDPEKINCIILRPSPVK
jgi:hypothetical protein